MYNRPMACSLMSMLYSKLRRSFVQSALIVGLDLEVDAQFIDGPGPTGATSIFYLLV